MQPPSDGYARLLLDLDDLVALAGTFLPSSAERARLREVISFVPTSAFTRSHLSAARSALSSLGLSPEAIPTFEAESAAQAVRRAWPPGARADNRERRFVISSDAPAAGGSAEPAFAARSGEPIRVVPAVTPGTLDATADFVARRFAEAADLVLASPTRHRLSVILMAFNERASIAAAVEETRRFCRAYLAEYEILVVDDGSSDGTADAARAADDGDVTVLVHPLNGGMGATMRTGYRAAKLDYLVALPADRQIRAQQLAPFLCQLAAHRCVHGIYRTPHSGPARAIMSAAFRTLVRHVGALEVDFAGAYVFHRHWLARVDLARLPSQSFVFSFELLDALAQAGCQFNSVELRAFARASGESRVARPARIARIFGEVLRSRVARAQTRAADAPQMS